jgi:hypothetical protein
VGGGGRKTSSLQKKKSAERAEERKKEKLNLCEPSWLAQGQEGTKNENPSVHHPSKMVHWFTLALWHTYYQQLRLNSSRPML